MYCRKNLQCAISWIGLKLVKHCIVLALVSLISQELWTYIFKIKGNPFIMYWNLKKAWASHFEILTRCSHWHTDLLQWQDHTIMWEILYAFRNITLTGCHHMIQNLRSEELIVLKFEHARILWSAWRWQVGSGFSSTSTTFICQVNNPRRNPFLMFENPKRSILLWDVSLTFRHIDRT